MLTILSDIITLFTQYTTHSYKVSQCLHRTARTISNPISAYRKLMIWLVGNFKDLTKFLAVILFPQSLKGCV